MRQPIFDRLMLMCALAVLLCCAWQPAYAALFDAKTTTLDNGLQIIVIENNRAPVVHSMLWYKVGSADEEVGKSGLAHFFEHLMFRGTEKYPDGDFSKIVKSLGGVDNAFTSYDATAYHQTLHKDHLGTVLEMEADRMVNLILDDETLEKERKVILEERRERVDNSPRQKFGEQMRYTLFVNHPYNTPVIGWAHEIQQLSYDDLRSFYKKWYKPNNAVLIVSGDTTLEEVEQLAKKHFGPIPAGVERKRDRTTLPVNHDKGHALLTLIDPLIRNQMYQKTYVTTPSRVDLKHDMALDVLSEIMSGGASSRLYKKLVVEEKIAVAASLSYSGGLRDYAMVSLGGVPAPGYDITDIETALEQEIALLFEDGIGAQEFEDAKTRLKISSAYARDGITLAARLFGNALTSGHGLDYVENWLDRLEQLTEKDVMDAALRVFKDNPYAAVRGHLLPVQSLEQDIAEE